MKSKTREIDRSIFALTLPAIASNITVPLLGLSDTAISGHLGNESFLAAIATGTMMFNVIYLLCGFLRMATTGLTAEAYGRKSERDISVLLLRSVSLALSIGVAAIILQIPLVNILEWIIDPQGDSLSLATEYFAICIWGAPALLLTLSINGWFVGMQNTVYPMVISIAVNIFNIVSSLLFVFPLDFGFKGVALGTLCSNWLGAFLAVALLLSYTHRKGIRFNLKENPFSGDGVRRFFNVSGDLVLRSCCILGVTLAVTSLGARMGELTLAANSVMMQFFLFFTYFMDGFAFSGEALVGKWSGSGNHNMLSATIRRLFLWTAITAIGYTLIYLVGIGRIVALLTDVETVRLSVAHMKYYVIAIPLVSAWAFILDGIFIGFASTRRMFVTILIASVTFGIIAIAGVHPGDSSSNSFLWISFLSYLFIRGIGLLVQLPAVMRKR